AEDGIRAFHVTGVQTCALPIFRSASCRTLCTFKTAQRLVRFIGQALDRLVPVCLRHCCPYTPGLSTSSSIRGLTRFALWEISSRSEERRVGKACSAACARDGV